MPRSASMDDAPTTLSRRVWTAAASEALRPYVRSFIAQSIDVPDGETATLTVAATVYPVLLVTYAGAVRSTLHHEGEAPIPEVAITGPVPEAFETTLAGRPRGFFVQFEPAAPLALLSMDGAAYRSGLDAVRIAHPDRADRLGAWGRGLAVAGDEGEAFGDRVALTERLLTDLLEAGGNERAAFAAQAAACIVETDGTRPVSAVAADLGVSVSTLRRRLGEDLGISPKPFSAIVRFRHALAYIHAHPGTSWARVAARFGYADQSHLIRDYKRFAGVVPTQWDEAERFIDLTFGILEAGG